MSWFSFDRNPLSMSEIKLSKPSELSSLESEYD